MGRNGNGHELGDYGISGWRPRAEHTDSFRYSRFWLFSGSKKTTKLNAKKLNVEINRVEETKLEKISQLLQFIALLLCEVYIVIYDPYYAASLAVEAKGTNFAAAMSCFAVRPSFG